MARIASRKSAAKGIGYVRWYVDTYDLEPDHPIHVAALACKLFDISVELHGMGEVERELLEAGSLLHDIGWTIEGKGHHKHSRDIILSEAWPGFDDHQRQIILVGLPRAFGAPRLLSEAEHRVDQVVAAALLAQMHLQALGEEGEEVDQSLFVLLASPIP